MAQTVAAAINKPVWANKPIWVDLSSWMVYFAATDVETSFRKAMAAGAREMLAPQDFPGGRFAILSDPQGATFGLQQLTAR